jgi:uncharacterized repeat protein (TIGR01451 family)/MYXO-CTERM domain-containing protein
MRALLSLMLVVAACSERERTETTSAAAEAGTPPAPTYSRNHPDSITILPPIAIAGTCPVGAPCFVPEPNGPLGPIDSYFHDVYERPMGKGAAASTYYPAIDITSADTGLVPTWIYYRLNLAGPEAGQLPYFYSVELNFDADARGDAVVELAAPSSSLGNAWSTNNVVVRHDANESIGGPRPLLADGVGQAGGGYEHEVFDSGANSAPGQEGGTTAVQARVTGSSIEIAIFRPFLESLTTDVVSGAGFRPYASRSTISAGKLYTHDDNNRSGVGSPYPWLTVAGAPATCPGGASGDDGLSASQLASLESGTRVNTGIANPCYAEGDVYEFDSAGTVASLSEKDDVVFDVDLALTKTAAPSTVTVGQQITYTLTITNETPGTGQATNVVVVDTLPPNVTFVSASAGCTHAGTVTCAAGTMANGAVASFTIVVAAASAGTTSNTAVVSSDGDELTPANNTAIATTTVNPPPPVCPNSIVEAGEFCDDGNTTPNDGCENNCTKSNGQTCGAPIECNSGICDQGTCEPPNTCGNGVHEAGEICDDSNTIGGDGCEATCKLSDGEDCDAPSECDSNLCIADVCVPDNVCGNGVLETGEVCDDGNATPSDGCEATCKLSLDETCAGDDDCDSSTCDRTSNTCEPDNTCGNGDTEPDEACDDGNTADGDGCNNACLLEDGELCTGDDACASGTCEGAPPICGGSDTDLDSIRDIYDLDDDNDGSLDTVEGDGDTDGDGVPDRLDLDSDNDGIADAIEAGHDHPDVNGDFVADCPELVGANGFCNGLETAQDSGIPTLGTRDHDGDGVVDYLDLDSDNDGIADVHEGGARCADANDNGVCDANDEDGDGIVDSIDMVSTFGTVAARKVTDVDGDGVPDVHDLDSDADGLWDITESKNAALDENADGVIDETGDGDGDGIRNAVDADGALFGGLRDSRRYTDPDPDPDHQDPDQDGDGVLADNCPNDPNPDQLDTDGDGIGDDCDESDNRWGIAGGGCGCASTTNGSSSLVLGVAMLLLLTRRRRRVAIAAVAACALAMPATSEAQVIEAQLNAERFQIASDVDGILDVESGRVRKHLELDLGVWFGYANDPLTIYRVMDDGRERTSSLVKNQVGGELVASIGFFELLQLGVGVPLIFSQSDNVDDGATMPSGPGSSFAVGDVRAMAKAQLLRQGAHGLDLSLVAAFTFPTSSGEGYVGDTWLTFAPALAVSRGFDNGFRMAFNVGYRSRERREQSADLVIDDELLAGVGAAYDLDPIELELGFGVATAATDPFGSFNRNYAEIKPGATIDFPGPVSAFVAGGFGVAEGFGTPDWRVLAGLRLDRELAEAKPPASPDTDKDGLVDTVDKCVTEPEDKDGFEDTDGCPEDDDKDGIADASDKCRREAEDKDAFEDADGCPDPDNDNDKILDASDKCPLDPEDLDGFEDTDGCAETDNDKDTVLDAVDACPIVAGPVENKGCPFPDRDGDGVTDRLDNCPDWAGKAEFHGCNGPQLVKITETRLELLDTLLFATRSTAINKRSFRVLDAAALVLKNHKEMRIEIEGHTDDRGSDAFNQKLSEGRANAVKTYFIKKGVAAARLSAKGYGEAQPIGENATPAGRGKNRRVEFVIVRDVETTVPAPATAPAPKP